MDELSVYAQKFGKQIGYQGKVTVAQEGLERLL
jgi:hypothetical protein